MEAKLIKSQSSRGKVHRQIYWRGGGLRPDCGAQISNPVEVQGKCADDFADDEICTKCFAKP